MGRGLGLNWLLEETWIRVPLVTGTFGLCLPFLERTLFSSDPCS